MPHGGLKVKGAAGRCRHRKPRGSKVLHPRRGEAVQPSAALPGTAQTCLSALLPPARRPCFARNGHRGIAGG